MNYKSPTPITNCNYIYRPVGYEDGQLRFGARAELDLDQRIKDLQEPDRGRGHHGPGQRGLPLRGLQFVEIRRQLLQDHRPRTHLFIG